MDTASAIDEGASEPVTQGSMRTVAGAPLPLEHTRVDATIAGPLAEVVVRQRFRNAGDAPIEAVYLFPLPHEASVHRMEFRIADRVVKGVVREREEARRAYEQARAEGRAATLLEEDTPSLFSLSIANVAPGAVIDVELAYQEIVAYDDGRWRFAFPMVAPERYREGPAPSPGAGMPPPRVPTGERGADVELTVRFPRAAGEVDELACPTHLVALERDDGGGELRARLRTEGAVANRDFVLTWRAARDGVRATVLLEREAGRPGTFLLLLAPSAPRPDTEALGGAGDALKALRCANCGALVKDLGALREIPGVGAVLPCGYCGAVLTPATATVTRAARPRDVLVLVDRSGSMRGTDDAARAAVAAVLGALPPGDAVQVTAFHHDLAAFDGDGTRFVANAPELVATALAPLAARAPFGGTALEQALSRSSAIPPREGRTRVVVLITDAAVGNEGRLLRRVPELIGPGARLFVLGMGAAVDRRLVERLARAGHGASDALASLEPRDEAIARFARRVREAGPVLTGLAVNWEGAGATDLVPSSPPDLFAGQPLRVLGRFEGTGPSRVVLTGATADGRPFRQEIAVELPAQSSQAPGLARVWARQRVAHLVDAAGRDASHATSYKHEALLLSLEHSIVGPFTSIVAEDSQTSVAKKRARRGRLRVVLGPDVGRSLELDSRRRSVGRASSADLRLADGSVSRLHFDVGFDGEAFVLRDVSSTNGTRVDKAPVRRARLAPGMSIELGNSTLKFELVDESEPDAFFEFVPSSRVDVPLAAPSVEHHDEGADDDAVLRSAAPRSFAGPPAAPRAVASTRASMLGGAPPMAPRPGAPGAAMPAPAAMAPPPAVMRSVAYAPSPPMPPPAPPLAGAPMPPSRGAPQSRHGGPPPQVPVSAPGSEPYPENELRALAPELRGELDLAILVDATGSMGPYIEQVRERLLELVEALRRAPLCRSLRIAVVSYRDHPPEEPSYVTRVLPLTDDIAKVREAVLALEAAGGGDGPEAVTDGLFDVVRLAWRPGAVKAVVWFGDAPPHGVEPTGDSFPDGCPCRNHWFAQAESCHEMGVAVYAIGCLPTLRSYAGAEGVYRTVARATRGMFLPLREAELLVPLIAGAAESALDGERIDAYVARLLREQGAALARTDERERVRWLTEALRAQSVRPRAMRYDERNAGPAPMRFRDVEPADVSASLERLRSAGQAAI